jgi:hypothetical protein
MSSVPENITDVMAFAFKNGSLTKAIFFGGETYPLDLNDDEERALDAAYEHLMAGTRALLRTVEVAFSANRILAELLESGTPRNKSLDNKWGFDKWIKAHLDNATLWTAVHQSDEDSGPYCLRLSIWCRRSIARGTEDVLHNLGLPFVRRGELLEFARIPLDEANKSFEDLASWAAERAEPVVCRLSKEATKLT